MIAVKFVRVHFDKLSHTMSHNELMYLNHSGFAVRCCIAGVMGSWVLLRDAATIAMDLQLRLPPLNAEALLQRFCFDLALPLVSSCPPSALSLLVLSGQTWQLV